MAPKIQSSILEVKTLGKERISTMYELFSRYYTDVSREQFVVDLHEKTHVFWFQAGPDLVGFSTIFRKRLPEVPGATFLYSGDTVMREDHWGSKALQMTFFRYILESKLRSPFQPVYWMLISKGYKTYLMMRRNFGRSWPSPVGPTPEPFRGMMDRFYAWKFGRFYRPAQGLVVFDSSKGAVKGDIAEPGSDRMNDPDVVHFLKMNPNYKDGVELACIAEIRFEDFAGHLLKYFIKRK